MVTTNKCCDKCYSTYTTDDWPSHETLDACINQGCECHTTPTVEPTECDHSAMVGGFCKCARKALNLTEPTENTYDKMNKLADQSADLLAEERNEAGLKLMTPTETGWEEKIPFQKHDKQCGYATCDSRVMIDFIRETLATQKEELLKELEERVEGLYDKYIHELANEMAKSPFGHEVFWEMRMTRLKNFKDTIIKNLKGGV